MPSSLLLGAVLLAVAWVHSPALDSPFTNDDFLTLYDIANLPLSSFLVRGIGGHLYLTRNAVFLAFVRTFGLNPAPYFVAALFTHLLNVTLLFLLVKRLTGRAVLAAFGAALWGMQPTHQASVGWYSAYGNVLAGTFVLLFFLSLSRRSVRREGATWLDVVLWVLLLFAAASSYGTGFAVAVASAAVVWLFLPPECGQRRAALSLLALAAALAVLYRSLEPAGTPVSWTSFPVAIVASMWLHLTIYGIASLLLGPFVTVADNGIVVGPLSGAGLAQTLPVNYVVAVMALLALGCAYWWADATRRRQMLGFAIVTASVYGLIALARGPIMLLYQVEMARAGTTPRYHYVATIGLAGLVSLGLAGIRLPAPAEGRRSWPRAFGPAVLVLWLGGVCFAYGASAAKVETAWVNWSRNAFDEAQRQIQSHLDRAGPTGPIYVPNRGFRGMALVRSFIGPKSFPGLAAIFVITHPENTWNGRPVYFIESDPALVEALRSEPHTRIGSLVITRKEARRLRAQNIEEEDA